MGKAGGFITLHRQILDWEWYRNINTKVLFLHLLLTANFTDGQFEGQTIRRGQVVTSLTGLSEQTGLSVRQVRVSLEHLKMTGEVTSKSFPRYRVITIVKYDEYQTDDKVIDKQMTRSMTSKRQADDKLMTSSMTSKRQQYNNNNNDIYNKGTMNISCPVADAPGAGDDPWFTEFWEAYPRKEAKKNALAAWRKLKIAPPLMADIMYGLRKWTTSDQWTRDGGRYIPLPATWLNGRRWEDEITAPAPAKPTPAPVKRNSAGDYEQRDYSGIQQQAMDRTEQRIMERLCKQNGLWDDYKNAPVDGWREILKERGLA